MAAESQIAQMTGDAKTRWAQESKMDKAEVSAEVAEPGLRMVPEGHHKRR